MPKPKPPPVPPLFYPDGRLSMERFTDGAAKALRAALEFAKQTHWDSLRSPHVFMGLLRESDAALRKWAKKSDLDIGFLLGKFQEMFNEPDGPKKPLLVLHREFLSDNLIRFLRAALARAVKQGRKKVTSIDLLISILTAKDSIAVECLRLLEISAVDLAEAAEMSEKL